MDTGIRPSVETERRIVREQLALPMLFVDAGAVHEHPASAFGRDGARRLAFELALSERRSNAATAALLCRVLLNPLISSIRMERADGAVRLRSTYALSSGAWTIDVTATPPAPT